MLHMSVCNEWPTDRLPCYLCGPATAEQSDDNDKNIFILVIFENTILKKNCSEL